MKIAIHDSPGSFSKYWIEYCEKNSIQYKIVNAYSNDLVKNIEDCDVFMWHHHHGDYRDVLFAKQLLYSLQASGKKVFPDYNTCWHFDDKLGQKYLLESIAAPIVPSHVFYTKHEALDWLETVDLPLVYKLRGGAGAANVKLVKTKRHAKNLINKSFGRGVSQFNRFSYLNECYKKWRYGDGSFISILKGIYRFFVSTEYSRMHPKEKGYIYFQDFIPQNDTDYRIKVVDGKCWGFQRGVRQGDFRASGSGNLIFDSNKIPLSMVKIAQEVAKNLSLQSVAFDFIENKATGEYLIIEMSYGFGFDDNERINGYWDEDLNWHAEEFNPFEWMIQGLLRH